MKVEQHYLFHFPEVKYIQLLTWPFGVCREDLFGHVKMLLGAAFPDEKQIAVMIMCEVEMRYGYGVAIGSLEVGYEQKQKID